MALGRVLLVSCAAVAVAACGPSGAADGDCEDGLTSCGGECVDVESDPANCGGCGNACAGGQVCDGSGTCAEGCSGGLTNCDGMCVDITANPDHCGACGAACEDTEQCAASECVDDSCTEAESEAMSGELPADIIVVVDNSGSMTDEAGFVQDSMNDFVSIITASDIDARVILISDDSTDEQGICVPGPLGSGSCPADENLPEFRHVVQSVGSSNSLQLILDTYPQWQSSLRPTATRTIAVISDDNSALGATDFRDMMVALDPTFADFRFHAIVAPYDLDGLTCFGCSPPNCATCDPCCGIDTALGLVCTALPADQGTVYQDLITLTGGVEGNLCTQDFLPAFMEMATAVVGDSDVDCVYDIPDPGGGLMIDYTRVNVEYRPDPGSPPVTIPHVPGGMADCGAGGGWYYDDPTSPSQVILCPETCSIVQANPQAKITVKFGCATVIP